MALKIKNGELYGYTDGKGVPRIGSYEKVIENIVRPTLEELQAENTQTDPTGRTAHTAGAKLDAGKSPVFQGLFDYFPRACLAIAQISGFGASKYLWKGWESVPDGFNRYSNALARHLLIESFEKYDPESKMLHASHSAWNACARLELLLREEERQMILERCIRTPKDTEDAIQQFHEYADDFNWIVIGPTTVTQQPRLFGPEVDMIVTAKARKRRGGTDAAL